MLAPARLEVFIEKQRRGERADGAARAFRSREKGRQQLFFQRRCGDGTGRYLGRPQQGDEKIAICRRPEDDGVFEGRDQPPPRVFPVAAPTSMTRKTWCPRWLYSNVKPRLSFHHFIRDKRNGFGNSTLLIGISLCAAT